MVFLSPVRKGVVTTPAVVNKVDGVKSLIKLLPGVRIAGQQSHLALVVRVVEMVGRGVVEMRVEMALGNHNAVDPEIQFFRADENNA